MKLPLYGNGLLLVRRKRHSQKGYRIGEAQGSRLLSAAKFVRYRNTISRNIPGNKQFVADEALLNIQIEQDWFVSPTWPQLQLHDAIHTYSFAFRNCSQRNVNVFRH